MLSFYMYHGRVFAIFHDDSIDKSFDRIEYFAVFIQAAKDINNAINGRRDMFSSGLKQRFGIFMFITAVLGLSFNDKFSRCVQRCAVLTVAANKPNGFVNHLNRSEGRH